MFEMDIPFFDHIRQSLAGSCLYHLRPVKLCRCRGLQANTAIVRKYFGCCSPPQRILHLYLTCTCTRAAEQCSNRQTCNCQCSQVPYLYAFILSSTRIRWRSQPSIINFGHYTALSTGGGHGTLIVGREGSHYWMDCALHI